MHPMHLAALLALDLVQMPPVRSQLRAQNAIVRFLLLNPRLPAHLQLLDGHSHSIVLVRVPILEDVSFCLSITFLFIIFPSLVSISLSDISLFGFVLLDSFLITLL